MPLRSPSTMRCCSRSSSGSSASSSARDSRADGRRHALEHRHERVQRVIALAAPVVDQVESDLALLVVDPVHRQDLRRVHDRGVQAGLLALVQEHRVQHLPCGRIQAERDVRKSEGGLHIRVRCLSSRMASMVSMPSLRDSSWPVQMVKVRQSMRMSRLGAAPVAVISSISRSAIRPSSRRCGPGPLRRW